MEVVGDWENCLGFLHLDPYNTSRSLLYNNIARSIKVVWQINCIRKYKYIYIHTVMYNNDLLLHNQNKMVSNTVFCQCLQVFVHCLRSPETPFDHFWMTSEEVVTTVVVHITSHR